MKNLTTEYTEFHGEENEEISLTEAQRRGVAVCFIIVLTTKIL